MSAGSRLQNSESRTVNSGRRTVADWERAAVFFQVHVKVLWSRTQKLPVPLQGKTFNSPFGKGGKKGFSIKRDL
jgi:hypothetical protein